MNKKVIVVGGAFNYHTPFEKWGQPTSDDSLIESPEKVSFVLFTGGEDVSPYLYAEQKNPKTFNNPVRDEHEVEIFERAKKHGLPMVGICRGSQFLCVMAGGKLIQDVTGHTRWHNIRTDDGRLINVSSTHHQMQLPGDGTEILAWAEPRLSLHYEGAPGAKYNPDLECDCVYYPNINAVAMQYHPEYMDRESEGFKYAGELVERFFG